MKEKEINLESIVDSFKGDNVIDLHGTKYFSFDSVIKQSLHESVDSNLTFDNEYQPKPFKNKLYYLISGMLGLGVGLASMPIFNNEVKHLDAYSLDVHENETSFTISTINTLLLTSITSGIFLYNFFKKKHENQNRDISELQVLNKKRLIALKLCQAGSIIGGLIPVGLLWKIELQDQKDSNSKGFDEYMLWATASTAPFFIYKTLNIYQSISKYITEKRASINLDTIGSKIVTYGLSGISLVGRGISFTYILNELQKEIGIDEDASLIISIIIGGVLGNIILGSSEYSSIKKLFEPSIEELDYKKISLAVLSTLEGGWVSLPLISQGLAATKDWNTLLKGAIFTSFFLSHMTHETFNIYNSINNK